MDDLLRYGPHAIVTGAAQGTGLAFAEALAAAGLDLTLVDLQAEALAAAAADLRESGRRVETVAGDVSDPDVVEALLSADQDRPIGVAVINAAACPIGDFLGTPLAAHRETLAVNGGAALELVHPLAGRMVARGRGAIVLMSSGSALHGAPRVAHYAATKAYLKTLAEGLWDELRPTGVDVVASIPGVVRTPRLLATEPDPDALKRVPVVEPSVVARDTLAALGHGPICFPGRAHRWSMRLLGVLPRRLARWLTARQVRGMYP